MDFTAEPDIGKSRNGERQSACVTRVFPDIGVTVFYLSVLVLLPIIACFFEACSLSFDEFWRAVWTERARSAYLLTFGAAFVGALVNLVLGLLLAWVLVRYKFTGKKIVDSLVDLPLALPTAVGGLVYSSL